MPIYNGIEFIDESVCSIINQTFQEWELIIGINGHETNSQIYQIAKKYESKDTRIYVYDLIDIKGKSNALNYMLKYTNYNWISLLDVDDVWLRDKLLLQVPYMDKYGVIGTQCKYFGDKTGSPKIPIGDITSYNFLLSNPVINSSCLLRKELCYWDKDCIVEDYDLWIRLWKHGNKFYNIDKILVKHRIHQQSAFNSKGNHIDVPTLIKKYSN